jgi:hypothetical protein
MRFIFSFVVAGLTRSRYRANHFRCLKVQAAVGFAQVDRVYSPG